MLDEPDTGVNINWWRPGGSVWFTVLHQAAWHGAPVDVDDELIRRGALRSLTDAHGRTAYDIRCHRDRKAGTPKSIAAQQRRSLALRERCLRPTQSPLAPAQVRVLDRHLADVIDGRIGGPNGRRNARSSLRYPPVGILHEVPGQQLWFPVGGMYGGFLIALVGDCLDVKSWCRIVGGSGQQHFITSEGAILVERYCQDLWIGEFQATSDPTV